MNIGSMVTSYNLALFYGIGLDNAWIMLNNQEAQEHYQT